MATIPLRFNALVTPAMVNTHRGITLASDANTDDMVVRLINVVTGFFEQECNRTFLRRVPTEYYDGDKYRFSIPLKAYPIVSITNVWDDPNHAYNTIIPAANYGYHEDSGILFLNTGEFLRYKKNIKVTYTGGYARYYVEASFNDRFVFREAATGTYLIATVEPGEYTAETLATALKTALDAAGTTFTVTYNSTSRKFTITQSTPGTFQILLNTTDAEYPTGRSIYSTIGFTTGATSTANKTGATAYTTDVASGEAPMDLQWAVVEAISYLFEQTKGNVAQNRFGISGINLGDSGAQYFLRSLPDRVKDAITFYKGTLL